MIESLFFNNVRSHMGGIFRKLSERPSVEELEQRNILRAKDASISSKMAMDETRKVLLRKVNANFSCFILVIY